MAAGRDGFTLACFAEVIGGVVGAGGALESESRFIIDIGFVDLTGGYTVH